MRLSQTLAAVAMSAAALAATPMLAHAATGTVPTTTVITSAPNPSTQGQSVSFVSTVTGLGNGAPTGVVTFYDGATVLGTAPLAAPSAFSAQAIETTSALSAGTHSITAQYSGDGTYAASTSTPYLQVVTAVTPPPPGPGDGDHDDHHHRNHGHHHGDHDGDRGDRSRGQRHGDDD